MNLVDELLKADTKKADELKEGVFMSERLAAILGKDKPVQVKFRELKTRRLNDIIGYQIDKKGNVDLSKTYDANLMACVESIVEPDLRNKDLQAHFGCTSAKDLCEKLFAGEARQISDEITALSGMLGDEKENEVKN